MPDSPTATRDYWADRCPGYDHSRGHHGEGGCTARPGMFSRTGKSLTCGCRIRQGAIPSGSPESHGPAVGGSESRVAPGQPADGERSAPPTGLGACTSYTARKWMPTSEHPEVDRCVNCGQPAAAHSGRGGDSRG